MKKKYTYSVLKCEKNDSKHTGRLLFENNAMHYKQLFRIFCYDFVVLSYIITKVLCFLHNLLRGDNIQKEVFLKKIFLNSKKAKEVHIAIRVRDDNHGIMNKALTLFHVAHLKLSQNIDVSNLRLNQR
ncbi:hypothetical protein A9D36_10320 [Bacillus subtilis]|nr:hypothetical protein A9D36_10320 [Bacillus subtilis]